MSSLLPLSFSLFLDTYYAYDFNRPADQDRSYTTQPGRHDQPDINLAFVDATLAQERTRGRLALQWGQSVQKNTPNEPGPNRVFQEAYLGRRLGEHTWIDAGVFLGNIGAESWISKDNWTYSRALNLDYVPYYSAGLRLEHRSFQLQLLNGWQNISENNEAKAIGMQYKRDLGEELSFTYNNFLGDETVVSERPRFRGYHNFIFKWTPAGPWGYLAAADLGHQAQQRNDGVDAWGAITFTVRRVLDEKRALAGRGEYYADPHQANVVTGTPNGFRVLNLSVNYDQKLQENILWRTELRGFQSRDRIYPQLKKRLNRHDGLVVTSLSFWI